MKTISRFLKLFFLFVLFVGISCFASKGFVCAQNISSNDCTCALTYVQAACGYDSVGNYVCSNGHWDCPTSCVPQCANNPNLCNATWSCGTAQYTCNFPDGTPGKCCDVGVDTPTQQCYCHRTPASSIYKTPASTCNQPGGIVSEFEREDGVVTPYHIGDTIKCGLTGYAVFQNSRLYCGGVPDAPCSGWYQETVSNFFNAPIEGDYDFFSDGSIDILSMDLDGSNTEPPHSGCSGADNYVGLYCGNNNPDATKDQACYLMNNFCGATRCGSIDRSYDGVNTYVKDMWGKYEQPNWNPSMPWWWRGHFEYNRRTGDQPYNECIIGSGSNRYENYMWSRRHLTQGLHKMYMKGYGPLRVRMAGTPEGQFVTLANVASGCPVTSCDCQCSAPPVVTINASATNANGVTTVSWNAPASWGTECPGSTGTQQYGYCFGRTSGACDIAEVKTTSTSASVNIASGQWYLTVKAYNKCGSFSTQTQGVYVNSPPTITVTNLITPENTTLPVQAVDGVSSSQTCELAMDGAQTLDVNITGSDNEGGSDISSIEMKLMKDGTQLGSVLMANGTKLTVSGLTSKATFAALDLSSYMSYKSVDIYIRVTDKTGATTGWVLGRRVRIWDCKVTINGEVYDSSNTGTSCNATPSVGYSLAADDKMNFKNATFTNNGVTVDAPATTVSTFGPVTVTWGLTYTTALNNDLNGGSPQARWEGVGNFQCNNQATLNNALANPYTDNPTVTVKYSVLRNQDPWYQVTGAGVRAGGKVYDPVPPTCTGTCINAISKQDASAFMNNGLVAATNITSGLCITGCTYGKPNNLYSMTNPIGKKYGYDYFYNEVYAKMGIGTTFSRQTSFSELPTRGVVFVDGDLTVNSSSLTPVAKKQYLLVVVRGNIIINPGVNLISGIFVTSGDFVTKKNNTDTPLTIDGVVYAHGSARMGSGFNNAVKNNNLPGVTVNYRPDFIFALPGSIASKLANWQETAN